jgi:carboxylate-amine ligase
VIDSFIPSKPLTVGVELELQLVDPDRLGLVNGVRSLIELYPDSPYIKPEFIQNTVELASRVGNRVSDIHDHLLQLARELKRRCNEFGMQVCGGGTHPFDQQLALFTPLPRYLAMERNVGILGHYQVTFATHVHVGVTTAEDAIYLFRTLKPYLPLYIALSASSPFWRGYDTGFVAYRHRVLAASRNYGIPPTFEDWKQFAGFFEASQRAGSLVTMRDVHWDIRPRPHLGTVELRVMDAQPTIEEAMELGALTRVLAAYLLDNKHRADELQLPHALPWWLERDNHYVASRLGLDANYVYNTQGDFRLLRDVWRDVVGAIRPYADTLGEGEYIDQLVARVQADDISFMRQRQVYRKEGELRAVSASLVAELDDELGHDA